MAQFLIRVFALLLATASIGIAQNSRGSNPVVQSVEGHFATAPTKQIGPVQARILDTGPVAKVVLEPVSAERLNQEMAKALPEAGVPLKIGFARDLPALRTFTQLTGLATLAPATAAQIASISITSADALGIRLGLLIDKMPASAKLRFYAKESDQAYEVTGREINDTIERNVAAGDSSQEAYTYWSPIINGQEVIVEFELPNGTPLTEVVFSIPRLSHLYSSPLATRALQEKIGQSGSCNLDSVCQSSWSNESLATAKMSFISGGSSYVCTGTLLNDLDVSTSVPYFLSANHCISSQTEASSLQTYWFYRSNSCSSGTLYAGTQTLSGGATLLYNSSVTDTSFMRLVGTPPAGTYFAGWTSTQQSLSTGITGIHNPMGDLQKISFGSITNYLTCTTGSSYSCSTTTVGSANHLKVVWNQGITEGGSSGSGIWVTSGASHYLVGQLHGGQSYCSTPTAPDNYGRFDVAYNASLYQWLGVTNTQQVTVTKSGNGTVTSNPAGISCGTTCSASFTSGTSVTLTAAPGSGNSFSGWSGACSGTDSTCIVTMSAAKTVTASFSINGSTLLTRYRLYHDGTKEHLYTTDTNEYSVLATRGWLAEGAIYQLYPGAGSLNGVAAVPFYRLYNRISLQHHWTTDANEYNVLGQGDWTREGIDGYILPSSVAGSMPVYRLYLNAFGGLHLWTTDLNEKTVLSTRGWVYEGVAGYVVPLQ